VPSVPALCTPFLSCTSWIVSTSAAPQSPASGAPVDVVPAPRWLPRTGLSSQILCRPLLTTASAYLSMVHNQSLRRLPPEQVKHKVLDPLQDMWEPFRSRSVGTSVFPCGWRFALLTSYFRFMFRIVWRRELVPKFHFLLL
jgi:hypothetical protein